MTEDDGLSKNAKRALKHAQATRQLPAIRVNVVCSFPLAKASKSRLRMKVVDRLMAAREIV